MSLCFAPCSVAAFAESLAEAGNVQVLTELAFCNESETYSRRRGKQMSQKGVHVCVFMFLTTPFLECSNVVN